MRQNYNLKHKNHKTRFNRENKKHNLALKNRDFSFITAISLVGFTTVSGLVLSNIHQFGSSASATASHAQSTQAAVTVSTTCLMDATINSEHTATLTAGTYSGDNGDYANGIGKTTINVICNDGNGHAIYAIGYSNDEIGNTKMIFNNNVGGNNYDIATGTAVNGDTSNWAMKVTAKTATVGGVNQTPYIKNNFDNYHVVPSEYTKVAAYNAGTDASVGTSIETTYAVYISSYQPAGSYTGQVKYILVHPNIMSDNTPFTNWFDMTFAEFNKTKYNSTNYYAMQDMESGICKSIPTPDANVNVEEDGYATQLIDTRDGNVYWIAKLMDGNCWMTQNLDFLIGDTSNPVTLTSENTDLNAISYNNVDLDGYSRNATTGVITWTPNPADRTTNSNETLTGSPATISSSTVTGWTNENTSPYQAEGGDIYAYQGSGTLATCMAAGNSEDTCAHYKRGNYYNWTAAVALNDSASFTTKYSVMPNSICPAGWRLPDGLVKDANNNVVMSDYNNLLNIYDLTGTGGKNADGTANGTGTDLYGGTNVGWKDTTNNASFNAMGLNPLRFVRSGRLVGSTLGSFGTSGLYWSSSVQSSSVAYFLYYDSGYLYPARQYNRDLGRSVRCIAR